MKKFLSVLVSLTVSTAVFALDNKDIVSFIPSNHYFTLVEDGSPLPILVFGGEEKGIMRGVENLSEDFRKVTGKAASIINSPQSGNVIIIGSLESSYIKKIADREDFSKDKLQGKYEKYIIKTVSNPLPGIEEALVVAGSDKRGTLYGIYELAEQIGVSPWYDWADVPIEKHKDIYIKKGEYTAGEPVVKVRGIFLNEEFPCLGNWVKNTFGTDYGDHNFYERVFELILRLRGNFIWPAMWGWAFYADDPLNSQIANEMGVMVGTSHHEPMARNHQEWARNRDKFGDWNYKNNKETIDRFFREGIERMKNTEDIVTIGMRGDGDEAMSDEADIELLQNIITNQRQIISDVTGRPASDIPQVWALYKEVLDYYDKGMEVPEDVTLLLCDDNWGNVRRVPELEKRNRKGGWGLYYHVDYVGAPRNSKLLNCTPVQNMWEQLSLAAEYGLDRLWILNVGDLKPMEYPITLFMDMAWNPKTFQDMDIREHTISFFNQQFGEIEGPEAARIFNLLSQYNGRVTPEMLNKDTYNLSTGEWKLVVNDYLKLEAEAWRQYNGLSPEYKDAYMQLILFPLQVMTNLYEMYYAQAMNHQLFVLGQPEANNWAEDVKRCFERDKKLMAFYNKEMSGGKWDGMMTQKHIGYTSWNDDFPEDTLPEVFYIEKVSEGGYVFKPENDRVVMESNHYYEAINPGSGDGKWIFTPHLGRTNGGMAVMPYTVPTEGSSLKYAFELPETVDSVKVHIIVKSNLAFKNKVGHKFSVRLNEGKEEIINYNHSLNEDPENIYTVFYPTVAQRVVEKIIDFKISESKDKKSINSQKDTEGYLNDFHTLTLIPLDPGIVFEKIVVDFGGYQPSYLHGPESPFHQL